MKKSAGGNPDEIGGSDAFELDRDLCKKLFLRIERERRDQLVKLFWQIVIGQTVNPQRAEQQNNAFDQLDGDDDVECWGRR